MRVASLFGAMSATVPKWQKMIAIPGMLIFGTCTVVIQKFLFEMDAKGSDLYPVHKFSKPWFQTNSMFIGMMLSLVVYAVLQVAHKNKQDRVEDRELQSSMQSVAEEPPKLTRKMFFLLIIPAACDLIGTGMMNIGLLYIQASVWQMLRGSMVLFSSIACTFVLKRKSYPYQWWAVLMVIVALSLVGFASVISTGVGKAGVTPGQVGLAITLTVLAQVIQASQIVFEDFLMHDMTASPFLIVGLEGFWGTIITCSIFMPITQFAGGVDDEGNGVHEDLIDTFKMMGNSGIICAFVVFYVFVILVYNITGMLVTNITSAVVRTILEGLRTLCIWVVQLIIHYSTAGNDFGKKHPTVGEEFNLWSILQLAGFLLLFTGMLVYNKIVRIPVFDYPDEPNTEVANSGIDDTPLVTKDDY